MYECVTLVCASPQSLYSINQRNADNCLAAWMSFPSGRGSWNRRRVLRGMLASGRESPLLSSALCQPWHPVCKASGRQSWMLTTQPHKLPPILTSLDLNTMWMKKRKGASAFLTFIQIVCTNTKKWRWGIVHHWSVYNFTCRRLIFTALFARAVFVCKCTQNDSSTYTLLLLEGSFLCNT